jgi:uncharacterized protein (TIGR01370 family)
VTINVSGSAGGGYITFQNYGQETPILDGTGLDVPADDAGMFLIVDQSYVVIKGFEIRNYRTATLDRVPVGIRVMGTAHHIQIRDNHIHHIETNATPLGPDLAGADAHGIAVYGTDAPASINHILIDGNELDNLKLGSSEALVLNGNVEVFTVTNNVVHDSDNIGIDCIGFEDTAPSAAYDQARDGVVAGNTVYNIDTLGNPSYGGERSAGGIYVDGGTRILVEHNRVYSSNIGIEIASEHQGRATSDVTVRNNLVYNNHIAGIALGGYDTERGSTENCTIVNNTLYNNDTQGDWNGEILIQFDTRNNVIVNNVVYASSQSLLIGNIYTSTGNTIDYNIFYAPAGIDDSEWEWEGTTHTGFTAYRAASGNDANSAFVDPELVNIAVPDLHLQAISPAIDAGQNLAAVGSYDIDGQARINGGAVDVGADEYYSPTWEYVYLPLVLRNYAPSAGPMSLADVTYWGYQITDISQPGAVDALAASHYDMLVLEPTRTDWSSDDKLFDTKGMVSLLKDSLASDGVHRKLLVAYIDIGEAEDWRWYWTWSTGWDCTGARPADWPDYIITCDPDGWSGNYPVAYWDPLWKDVVITGTNQNSAPYGDYNSIIDEVIKDGFDGIYLDWVEAFENTDVISAALTAGVDPAVEMIAFIQEMREYAALRNPNFVIIQQNAASLIEGHPELLSAIDALAQEAIWYDGSADVAWGDPAGYDWVNDGSLVSYYIYYLDQYLGAGLPVFDCEYALTHAGTAYANALNKGYVPYVTRRALSQLTTTPPPGY